MKFLHRKRCHSLVLKRARPLSTFFLSLAVDATRFFGCSVALVRRRSRSPGGTPIYLCLSPTSPWRVARLATLHGQASLYSFYSSSFSLESYTFKNSQKSKNFSIFAEISTKKEGILRFRGPPRGRANNSCSRRRAPWRTDRRRLLRRR